MNDLFIDNEELPLGYGLEGGGYRVTVPNETMREGRYVIKRKLGHGALATVWLALDTKENKHTAIKIIKSSSVASNNARAEVHFLQRIKDSLGHHLGRQHVVALHDYFVVAGDEPQSHICLALEPLGETLAAVVDRFCTPPGDLPSRGVPTLLAKLFTTQLSQGLDFIHTVCDIIHADLRLENVLVVVDNIETLAKKFNTLEGAQSHTDSLHMQHIMCIGRSRLVPIYRSCPFPPSASLQPGVSVADMHSIRIKISDFGSATQRRPQKVGMIQAPTYRAPEVILGYPWDRAIDLWSLGCMVFELVTGEMLIFSESEDGRETGNVDHLAQIIALMGEFPKSLLPYCRQRNVYFFPDGTPRFRTDHLAQSLQILLTEETYGFVFSNEDAIALCGFIEPLFALDPSQRSTAAQALEHPWLVLGDAEYDSPE